MILDIARFVEKERPVWNELDDMLRRVDADPALRLGLEEVRRLHYLYERTSADLAKIRPIVAESEVRGYLETLVARAYSEIHESRDGSLRLKPVRWFLRTFPRTLRRHRAALYLSIAVTVIGSFFGAGALLLDPKAKDVLIPFHHLAGDPSDRVAEEEKAVADDLGGAKGSFAGMLMTHNTRVSIFAMALGLTWGVGTFTLLFYNGVILGAVSADYMAAGEGQFLAGWLLPHGSVEIPAILIAGQAGFVIAGALIGWGRRISMRERLRRVLPDVMTLIGGVAVMLVWAGIVESFFSQYHEPVLPYVVKIGFGLAELGLLVWFLVRSGRGDVAVGGSIP